jgi:UDP-galactopyranose mutase
MYKYCIIGCGLFGSVFARIMTDHGHKCIILEKRNHIGGNCYSENKSGIEIHKYGPHVFHTDSKKVWNFVNKYSEFNHFVNNIKTVFDDKLYSLPINMNTFYELWGVKTPDEAKKTIEKKRKRIANPKNFEEWILSQVGEEIYQTIFYGYTKKQWNTEPKNLPYNIAKRIPIRYEFNNNYYYSKYQGIPKNGYSFLFSQMLKGVEVSLDTEIKNIDSIKGVAEKIVYSGSIDELFGYSLGKLEWMSHKFVEEEMIGDYQGNAIINYSNESEPCMRIVEHKFFDKRTSEKKNTIITKEYSGVWSEGKERMYPINNKRNKELYDSYKLIIPSNVIIGGRCGMYKYLDMDKTILLAMKACDNELL